MTSKNPTYYFYPDGSLAYVEEHSTIYKDPAIARSIVEDVL